jgi:hypothetical protein
MKFIDGPVRAGGAHPTSGLPGFPARDYMARGGSLARSPIAGKVSSSRPFGRLATQNPAAGFGGARMYLERPNGKEIYIAHFGLGPGDLLVKPGQKLEIGTELGRVWRWPNDPGRSHLHVGDEAGDPLRTIVDADGDIIHATTKPKVKLPILRKVDEEACVGKADEAGRWQVVRDGDVLFQGKYAEAVDFFEEKRAYWERRAA